MPDYLEHGDPDLGEVLSEDKFLQWFYDRLQASKNFFDPIWEENHSLWDMMAGESFGAAEKEYLRQSKRPIIDPPFAAGIIDTVLGAEMGQQVEPVFHGVDDGLEDEVLADWLTKLVRNGFQRTKLSRHLMEAYKDMLVGGYGFVLQYLDLEKVPIHPTGKALNYWNVYPDPDAIEENLVDGSFWIIQQKWKLADAKAKWRDKAKALEAAYRGTIGTGNANPKVTGTLRNGTAGSDKRGVTIFEFHYRKKMELAQWADPETGESRKGLKSEWTAEKERLDKANAEATRAYEEELEAYKGAVEATIALDPMAAQAGSLPQMPAAPEPGPTLSEEDAYFWFGDCYYRAYIAGDSPDKGALLEDERQDGIDEFMVKAVTGFTWKKGQEERVRFYGLLRKIYDLQLWFTRGLQNYLDLQARKIKGGGFIGDGAFENEQDYKRFVKESSIPGMWHKVRDASQITPNPPVQGEPGVQEIFRTMLEMIGLVSGVTQALQGTMTQDRANITISNMQEHGLQMLAPIRQPRMDFIMATGRLFAALALKYLPAKEIDRILGVQKVPGMTIQKDPQTGQEMPIPSNETGPDGQPLPMTAGRILKSADLLDYDVAVDTGVATINQKMQVFQLFNQHGMADVFQQVFPGPEGAQIWAPEFLRNLPFPGTVTKPMAERAEAFLQKQAQAATTDGMLQAFMQLAQSDPEAAQGVLQQMSQAMPPEDPGMQQSQESLPS